MTGQSGVVRWHPERVVGPCKAAFLPAAKGLEGVARGLAPKKTGRLAAGTNFQQTGETSGQLGVQGVPYAGPVIAGAAPHAILPKAGEALKVPFLDGFVSLVRHPGNKPHPYLQEAAPSFKPLYVNQARGLLHLGF